MRLLQSQECFGSWAPPGSGGAPNRRYKEILWDGRGDDCSFLWKPAEHRWCRRMMLRLNLGMGWATIPTPGGSVPLLVGKLQSAKPDQPPPEIPGQVLFDKMTSLAGERW